MAPHTPASGCAGVSNGQDVGDSWHPAKAERRQERWSSPSKAAGPDSTTFRHWRRAKRTSKADRLPATKAGKWDCVGRAPIATKAPQAGPKREGTYGLRCRFPYWKCHKEAGAAYRTRTCDPRITKELGVRGETHSSQRLRSEIQPTGLGDPKGTQSR